MKTIKRKYLQDVMVVMGTPDIKVITGVKCSGKSELLHMFIDYINENDTFKREVTPLLQIKDAYPKIIIARTGHDDYQYEGVQIIDIANWLIKKN